MLFTALTGVLTSSGTVVQDSAWPGYRLMDANGILKVLSDITGADSPGATYSTSSHLVWSGFGYNQNLRIQTRFADFGGTCDLNNPSGLDGNVVNAPTANYGNGLTSSVYQSGTFSTCDGNGHFSQNNMAPMPLMTRAAWMYRTCRLISVKATSAQIATLVARIRTPDPVPPPTNGTLVYEQIAIDFIPTAYNWCSNITSPSGTDYNSLFRSFYPGRTIPQMVTNSSNPAARGVLDTTTYTPAPLYKEKLEDLVLVNSSFIDTLSSYEQNNFEDRCTPGGAIPSLDQVKALSAWRALFLTMCSDPGWNVL